MRTFIVGDLHGSAKALEQCIERSGFDYEKDTLIQLGDICDGWTGVRDCVDILLKCKNLIALRGNHDDWFVNFLVNGKHPVDWAQGGLGTLKSYATAETRWEKKYPMSGWSRETIKEDLGYITNLNYSDIPEDHIKFFLGQHMYYIDDQNNLFVHAGFNRHYPFKGQSTFIYNWDRDLFLSAMSAHSAKMPLKFKDDFKNIFIGHTATTSWKTTKPIFADRLINLDTGAGFNGVLTIMDVETKEYWQSDFCHELYPEETGRRNGYKAKD